MEKEGNKIPVGIVFMGRGLGELLELKARCRRRLDFLDKYKGRISDYVYEKLRQEYSSYLEAVDGEVALGLADYEIKLSEIRLFSNQLKLLEKTHEERIQELALRHALGEYTKEQYDRLYAEHTQRMKRFAETIKKYSGEERKLAEFLEKVTGDGMIAELEAELEQEARAASQEETVERSMDKAAEAETEIGEKLTEQPAESEITQEAGLETPPEEQPPTAELLIESIERVDDHEFTEPAAMDTTLEEETAPGLREESPVPQQEADTVTEDAGRLEDEYGAAEQDLAPAAEEAAAPSEELQGEGAVEPVSAAEPEEDYGAGTADLPDLESLEEEKEEKAELTPEEMARAGERVSQEQKPSSGIILDAIFEDISTESLDAQAEQPAESAISAEPPAQSTLEEAAPGSEEVLPEEAAAPPPEKEEKPEESAVESETGQALDEADLPNDVETAGDEATEQAEPGSESAPLDLEAIMSAAAGTMAEKEEPGAPVSTGDLKAESETADESLPEPPAEVAEEEKPEPESTEISQEALEEEQQPRETMEQAPEAQETAERSEEQSEEISPEPVDQSAEKQDEVPDSSTKPQEETQEGEDEKDLVTDRAVSLDEKVELGFDLGGREDGTDKLLTVDQTIDAIKKKTVKCPKCGTMNYAIRWYCENCEATLTSL
jgi:ribosomal protein S27AE